MKHRFLAIGVLYLGFPFGGMGAAIATAFQLRTTLHWRLVFWLMTVINGLAALSWFLFYHPPTFHMKQKESRIHLIKNFDYVGTFLFIAGFVLFLTGLKWGGSTYAWNSTAVISTMVIGAVCLIILAFWEIYTPLKEPLIPIYLFRDRGWVASNLLLAIGASVYYATGLVWPQMVSAVYSASHHSNPMWAGYTSSLVGIFIAVGEMAGGLLAQKIGKVKYQCIFFVAVGSACLIGIFIIP
jgi:MFS family permease